MDEETIGTTPNHHAMPNKLPFVAAAFICEKVLQEADGVISAIRIVDVYALQQLPEAPGKGAEATTPPGLGVRVRLTGAPIDLTILIAVKAGAVTGKHALSVVGRDPEGKRTAFPHSYEVELNGEDAGANIIIRFIFASDKSGMHWFEVFWDGEPLTSIPLKLLQGQHEPAATP